MAKTEQVLRDFYHRIIGYIETDSSGDKIGRDFYRRIVGRYKSKLDVTTDFYGRIVGRGDILSSLVTEEDRKQREKK